MLLCVRDHIRAPGPPVRSQLSDFTAAWRLEEPQRQSRDKQVNAKCVSAEAWESEPVQTLSCRQRNTQLGHKGLL